MSSETKSRGNHPRLLAHLFVSPVDPEKHDRHGGEVDARKGPLRSLEVLASVCQPREGRVEVNVQGGVAVRCSTQGVSLPAS